MKVLIYGAGVIGCSYGWQLSKVGCDVTLLVKPERKQEILLNGINICCSDYRKGNKSVECFIFRPKVIDCLLPDNDYEYIIVSTNTLYLKDILPILAKYSGKSHMLFFQNMWNDFDLISMYLSPDKYFFGFPFMIGGGRNDRGIYCSISGIKQSHTPLGELDGKITTRVEKMVRVMSEANLKPITSKDIKLWLITHYAVAAGLSTGIMKAGSGTLFVSEISIMRETIKAIREGLQVCRKRGFEPKKERANSFYFLPLFIVIPIAKKVYSDEALCNMFDGHINHSPNEIKKMVQDVILTGQNFGVDMSNMIKLSK